MCYTISCQQTKPNYSKENLASQSQKQSFLNKIMLQAERIKQKIAEKGETVKTIAQKIGISDVSLYAALKGESDMRVSNVVRLCDALDLSLDEVVGRETTVKTSQKEYLAPPEQSLITAYRALPTEREKALFLAVAKQFEEYTKEQPK